VTAENLFVETRQQATPNGTPYGQQWYHFSRSLLTAVVAFSGICANAQTSEPHPRNEPETL